MTKEKKRAILDAIKKCTRLKSLWKKGRDTPETFQDALVKQCPMCNFYIHSSCFSCPWFSRAIRGVLAAEHCKEGYLGLCGEPMIGDEA